jgi:predicted transglutaminase-like cysteine proteinase
MSVWTTLSQVTEYVQSLRDTVDQCSHPIGSDQYSKVTSDALTSLKRLESDLNRDVNLAAQVKGDLAWQVATAKIKASAQMHDGWMSLQSACAVDTV